MLKIVFTISLSAIASAAFSYDFQNAARYSKLVDGEGIVAIKNDSVIFESYYNGYRGHLHKLYSGTKGFACLTAAKLADMSLLRFDEKIADTVYVWQRHRLKRRISLQQLLGLRSGVFSGGISPTPPGYWESINERMVSYPGRLFSYGPIPFQIFGGFVARKLLDHGSQTIDPAAFLEHNVLNRIGIMNVDWEYGTDGNPNLASGAWLTLKDWAKVGNFILRKGESQGNQLISWTNLKRCFATTSANRAYGKGFWLNKLGEWWDGSTRRISSDAPDDLVMAAGFKNQRLYVVPSENLVVAHYGHRNTADFDQKFLARVFSTKIHQSSLAPY